MPQANAPNSLFHTFQSAGLDPAAVLPPHVHTLYQILHACAARVNALTTAIDGFRGALTMPESTARATDAEHRRYHSLRPRLAELSAEQKRLSIRVMQVWNHMARLDDAGAFEADADELEQQQRRGMSLRDVKAGLWDQLRASRKERKEAMAAVDQLDAALHRFRWIIYMGGPGLCSSC